MCEIYLKLNFLARYKGKVLLQSTGRGITYHAKSSKSHSPLKHIKIYPIHLAKQIQTNLTSSSPGPGRVAASPSKKEPDVALWMGANNLRPRLTEAAHHA